MTTFNPENKLTLTYGEAIEPMMGITDLADAIQYKNAYLEFILAGLADAPPEMKNMKPEEILAYNISYFAASKSPEVLARVNNLFLTEHDDVPAQEDKRELTNEEKQALIRRLFAGATETIESCRVVIIELLDRDPAAKRMCKKFVDDLDKIIISHKTIQATWDKPKM